jgi:hypothetical protein
LLSLLIIATLLKVASSWLIALECPMTRVCVCVCFFFFFFFFFSGGEFSQLGDFFFQNFFYKKWKFCHLWGIFLPFFKIKIINATAHLGQLSLDVNECGLCCWPKCYHVLNWFFLPKPGFFMEFISIFSGRNYFKINISHILNPNLTK